MGLLCKRYDMIALLLQAAPRVHHNLPKAIITLNSPEAIIAGDLLCGRLPGGAFLFGVSGFLDKLKFEGLFQFPQFCRISDHDQRSLLIKHLLGMDVDIDIFAFFYCNDIETVFFAEI